MLSYHVPKWFSSLFSLLRNERQLPFCSEITLCCLLSAFSQLLRVIFCNILPGAGNRSDVHPPAHSVCGSFQSFSDNCFNVWLCGSVSRSAETHGCSQSSQGHVCYQIKATWKCHYADGIMISLNWRGAPYKMIIIWLTEAFYYQSKVSLEHFFMPSTLLSIVQKSLGHCVKHQ